MAEINISKDLVRNDEHATLSVKRLNVAIESTWEISRLVDVLLDAVPLREDGGFYVVRALTTRIEELNNIIMSALDDDHDDTNNLAFRLTRKRGEEVAA